MVIQFEFENKKKKKFSGGGIFLMPYSSSYRERQNGVVGSGMSIDEHNEIILKALNTPVTKSGHNVSFAREVSGNGFVAVNLK